VRTFNHVKRLNNVYPYHRASYLAGMPRFAALNGGRRADGATITVVSWWAAQALNKHLR
jgi:hypothetical protein